jgi:hypothetical protein
MPDTPRRYRVTPWPIWIVAPVLLVVAAVGAAGAKTAVDVVGWGFVALFALSYLYAAERCGVYSTTWGIESRMMRRHNSFRIPWSDIGGFSVSNVSAQLVIVVRLADGRKKLLPSTRAWPYSRHEVESICNSLDHDRMAAARTP